MPHSSTGAELAALRAPLEFIKAENPEKWSVFTDSKVALQGLKSALHRGSHEPMILEFRDTYHGAISNGHDIVLQWLPGHCGITGNYGADEAARFAHNDGPLVNIPVRRVDAATRLRTLARESTLAVWNTGELFNHRLHPLDPDLRLCIPPNVQRREATMLCRLWLGVASTKHYSFCIGMADRPNCEYCDCANTTEHLLRECPAFSAERQELRSALDRIDYRALTEGNISGPWPKSSAARKALKVLLHYLRATS